MADQAIRVLERTWRATGSTEDQGRWIRARIRSGDLSEWWLWAGAELHHPGCVAAYGFKPSWSGFASWFDLICPHAPGDLTVRWLLVCFKTLVDPRPPTVRARVISAACKYVEARLGGGDPKPFVMSQLADLAPRDRSAVAAFIQTALPAIMGLQVGTNAAALGAWLDHECVRDGRYRLSDRLLARLREDFDRVLQGLPVGSELNLRFGTRGRVHIRHHDPPLKTICGASVPYPHRTIQETQDPVTCLRCRRILDPGDPLDDVPKTKKRVGGGREPA